MQISSTYLDMIYNDNSDPSLVPYIKGGVFSHWFYLLVNGGTGTNGIGNNYNVYGIGMETAEKLIVKSVFDNYLDDSSTYPDASTNIIDASESSELFGENSFQALQVKNAWYAVGIGNQITQPTISGSDLVCYSGSAFTANNTPSGSAISWTTSANLVVSNGQNTNTPTIRTSRIFTNGAGWIQANFTSNGYTTTGPRKDIWAGKPGVPTTNPSGYPTIAVPLEAYLYIGLANAPGSTPTMSTTWWSTGSLEVDNATPSGCTFHAYDTGIGNFYVTTQNACGTSASGGGTVDIYSGGGGGDDPPIPLALSIQPNPANNYIDAKIINDDSEIDNNKLQIKLFNYRSIPVYKGNSHQKSFRISTNHLPRGLYILQVIYNGKQYSKQVLIEH